VLGTVRQETLLLPAMCIGDVLLRPRATVADHSVLRVPVFVRAVRRLLPLIFGTELIAVLTLRD
jgi:hypothetical protein